jgi:hypothetical protein
MSHFQVLLYTILHKLISSVLKFMLIWIWYRKYIKLFLFQIIMYIFTHRPIQHTDGNENINNKNSQIFYLLGSYSVYIGTHLRT